MFLTGFIQAIGLSFCLAFLNVFLRVAVHKWDVQPIIFTCVCLMTAAMVLSLVGGPGRLTKSTLKSGATWLYSFLLMAAYVTDVYIMQFLSATEASFYSRLTIPLALMAAWVLHKRSPQKQDLTGLTIIALALIWLTFLQPLSMLWVILGIVLLGAFIQTSLVVIAETHKESVAAAQNGTFRDRARVVGFVTFISSATFLFFTLFMSALFRALKLDAAATFGLVPEIQTFIHPPTIAAALFYGVLILPLIRYLKWAASYNLKAENLLVIMSFIPMMTLGLELLVSKIIYFPANTDIFAGARGQQLLIIAVLITLGAGLTSFLRVRDYLKTLPEENTFWMAFKNAFKPAEDLAIHHSDTAKDDYEIILNTLEYTSGDKAKAAALLHIPESTLTVLKEGKGNLALIEAESKKLAREYRSNVVNHDGLTGLLNRSGFYYGLRQALEKANQGALLYLDLDKFKPVNDTYGHDAGDEVLKEVAQRLEATLPSGALITRLGGDEFCVFISNADKKQAAKIAAAITEEIDKPYKITGVKKAIEISSSLGIAHFPSDGKTPEALIGVADKGMFGAKHGS